MPRPQQQQTTASTLAGAFYFKIKKFVKEDEFEEGDGTPTKACGPRDSSKDGIFMNSNNFIRLFSRWIP
jgi:hypothetical protein